MRRHFHESDIEEVVQALGPLAQRFAGKRVLLSGAAGFLGRYFVEIFSHLNQGQLAKNPVEVLALDNLVVPADRQGARAEAPGVRWYEHDVIEPFVPSQKIDFILHAAGIASPQHYRRFPLETLDVAVKGTRQFLDLAAKQQARMLFFSSSEIYGDPEESALPTPEDYRGRVSCLGPRACYDESKRLGETLCRIYAETKGLAVSIVRPFNVYGPGFAKNDYRVLPNFASRIVSGEDLLLYGNAKQTRSYCYVTDALNGMLRVLLLGRPGEPYNIGNPDPEISVQALAETLKKISPLPFTTKISPHPSSYPTDEPQRRCPHIGKAIAELNYHPKVGLEDGLRRFLNWALVNYRDESVIA